MSQTLTNRKYKATFILDTRGYKEPVETIIEKIKAVIVEVGGATTNEVNHGQREFVRVTDRKFPTGIYVEFDINAPATAPDAIKDKFKLDKTINRVLIQSNDK